MKFNSEDILYKIPIRFWEDKEPTKCVVKKEKTTSDVNVNSNNSNEDRLYVYSEEYGHGVFVPRRDLFYSKEKCIEAIDLYTRLHDLYIRDESDKISDRILEDI